MALIKCYECEKEISDKAPACPHCGAPKQEQETPELIIEEKAPEQTQVVKTEQETTRSFFEALDRYLSRYSPSGWTKKVRSEAVALLSTMSPQEAFDEMLRRGYDLRGDGSGLSRAEVPMATQQLEALAGRYPSAVKTLRNSSLFESDEEVVYEMVRRGYELPTTLSTQPSQQGSSQSSDLGGLGVFLIFAGIVVAGYFAFGYDTTVGATNAFTGEYMGRVNNIGLMNDRSIGVMIGAAVFFVGAIAALSSKSKK